jgi:3-dehydroquinate dehydratase/shikimate dehydrogenase
MICVSIAQTSHRFAFVDMLNAGRQCDLIEIRLDKFDKSPDIKALIETCPKPVIVSCRRPEDGGDWEGTEQARLALLRQAVLANADYVEIELDVADEIRRYGTTKRIITYTNVVEVPYDLEEIYEEARGKDPDVIKITVPTRNPEEAWPLIKIVAKGRTPTVAVGWGRSGIMLNVLGQRYKAPWTYAALEKGMEAYPGMATIRELEEIYDYHNISSKTPLLGVTGFSEEQRVAAQVLNHGFRLADNKTRCLPMDIGNIDLFAKVVNAIKLAGIIVDERHRIKILRAITDPEDAVKEAKASDFIAITGEKWCGFNTLYRAVIGGMEDAWREKYPEGKSPLQGRTVLVIGCSGTARSIATAARKRGALLVMADRDNERCQRVASEVGARFVPAGQAYSTMCDAMVLCPDDKNPERGKASLAMPKSVAREGMLGVDLTNFPYMTPFLDEVRALGGFAVRPFDIFLREMQTILKAFTGRNYTTEELREPIKDIDFDEV